MLADGTHEVVAGVVGGLAGGEVGGVLFELFQLEFEGADALEVLVEAGLVGGAEAGLEPLGVVADC